MIRNSIISLCVFFFFISVLTAPSLSPAGQHESGAPLALSAPAIYSGSWYNPDRNYEGFHIEILENSRALVIWFTYPGISDNEKTEQAWILGTGTFSGNTITILDAFKVRGPVFGENYDANDRVNDTWGNMTFTFTDPNNGRADYEGKDGSGTTNITRITGIADPEDAGGLPTGISGAWFNPETDGQGWFVEILSKTQALVYWFTYDENGNQAWSLGTGDITGTSIQVPEIAAGKGTRFGDEFNSEGVTLEPTAFLSLEFENCNEGNVSVRTTDGAVSLFYPVVRVTALLGHDCSGFSPDPDTRADGSRFFFVATSSSDTEYFRDLGISWETNTQYIFRINIDSGEVAEVRSNHSPSYVPSTIYSYTVDDLLYVRNEYESSHALLEYDPLTLANRWNTPLADLSDIYVSEPVDGRCSAVNNNSYFYSVKFEYHPTWGSSGGEFMRVDLPEDLQWEDGAGVQLSQNCYANLGSSNGVLYDAYYWHDYDGTDGAIGLYTRDAVSGDSSTIARFVQPNPDQFTSSGYSFHFDGNTVFIVREFSAGGFQVLRYIHGVNTAPMILYSSGSDISADFQPHFRDADNGFVAVGNGSGLIVLLDTVNLTIEYFDLATVIYDMAFLHVED